jgi:glycosyltransferase involved in cell wall biosynthesis
VLRSVGEPASLRVALFAGTLARGGAEKQLAYMARALRDAGVCLGVYALHEGEAYEAVLRAAGFAPVCVGQAANPALRLVTLTRALRRFRPHVVQAAQFYVNLYVALASRVCGSLAIGALRSDVVLDLQATGRWGRWLLRAPSALVANSHAARATAARLGVCKAKIHIVPNVIETSAFDGAWRLRPPARDGGHAVAMLVATLVPEKRVDRFLDGLALARRSAPGLKGVVVGGGPERGSLEAHAGRLGLLPGGVEFRGACDDIPRLLAEADMLALTSDHEGLPNVILEGMAARLPVVTTPVGDAALVVEDGVSGYVVPFDPVTDLANRLSTLAGSPALRQQLGQAGYARVTERYACAGLADRLLAVYRAVALERGHRQVLARLR